MGLRILCISFIIPLLMLSSCVQSKEKRNVIISGNIVDNHLNNYRMGGNLCRIGGKLYFNYQKSGFDYGLMEISDNSAKKIYHEGFRLKDNIFLNHRFLNYRDTLYSVFDNIKYFDFENKVFQDFSFIPLGENNVIQDISIQNRYILYTIADSTQSQVFPVPSELYLYDIISKTNRIIIDKDLIAFYPKNEKIYYVIQQNGNYKICIFDVELQQDIGIFDLPGYDANGLIIDDEKNMVFNVVAYDKVNDADLNSLYIIDLDDTTKLDLVYSCYDYYYNYNVYNGAVFVCTENGLKKFTDGQELLLCDITPRECYIVDEKWVYFVDYDSALWRVTQDGNDLQKVYG